MAIHAVRAMIACNHARVERGRIRAVRDNAEGGLVHACMRESGVVLNCRRLLLIFGGRCRSALGVQNDGARGGVFRLAACGFLGRENALRMTCGNR